MELNSKARRALDLIDIPGQHVFVTGRAGTGKSTLLRYLLENCDLGRTAIVAPTGVAAINVGGETIHRFFRFHPGITEEEVSQKAAAIASSGKSARVYQALDTLIIDEISMVRADLMDAIDLFLKGARQSAEAFGGVRIVAFGDLYQLPPVVRPEEKELFKTRYPNPYFFSSDVFENLVGGAQVDQFEIVELDHIYRQSDPRFIDLLNQVRSKEMDEVSLAYLNARVGKPPASAEVIKLTTTNRTASAINAEELGKLPGQPTRFVATISDDFPSSHFPTDPVLELKVQARVMLLTNDAAGRWVNGSLGTVTDIHQEESGIRVRLDDGPEVSVDEHTWDTSHNFWNPESGRIERQSLGSFTQIPVRLAWAMTIHKSQGKTFPQLLIDFERAAFAHGQAYVALSRGTSLDGLWLARPVRHSDVRLDRTVVKFLTRTQGKLAQQGREPVKDVLVRAIAAGEDLDMVYLKSNNSKTSRRITPLSVEEACYSGVEFLALTAYCHERRATRTFRVDQILSLAEVR